MSRLESVLRRAGQDLAAVGRRWALVGGLAVSVRTEPRFTRDIDLAVAAAGDPDAESAVRALQVRGYRVQALVEQEAMRRLATIRLIPPGEDEAGVILDVLFASSGVEVEVVGRADVLEILPGLPVPVARVGHLIALKLLSRDDRTRPQDRVDLGALLGTATPADVGEAREAIALIRERGFHRGRDLATMLDALIEERAR